MVNRAFMIAAALIFLPGLTFAEVPVQFQTLAYESGGRSVAVDVVEPGPAAQRPAVLLLHDRGGLSLYGPAFKGLALTLAARGFVVLTPHYFDASASPDAPEVTASAFEEVSGLRSRAITSR